MDFKDYCQAFSRSTQQQEFAVPKSSHISTSSLGQEHCYHPQQQMKINNYISIDNTKMNNQNPSSNNSRNFGRELSNMERNRTVQIPQTFIPQKDSILTKRTFRETQNVGGASSLADGNFNKARQMSVEPPLQQQQYENQNLFSRPSTRTQHSQYQSQHPGDCGKGISKIMLDRYQFKAGKTSEDKENDQYFANKVPMEGEEVQGDEQLGSCGLINQQFSKRQVQNLAKDQYFMKDKAEKNSVFQHVREIFDYLHQTENDFRARGIMQHIQNGGITERMRAILVDWLVDVHLKFKLIPETLYLAVNLIDRFIERKIVSKERLQLLGSTAMFVACKYEEIYPPELADFVFICDNLYSKQEILANEGELVGILDFSLSFSSPLRFLHRFAFLAGSAETHFFCAQYLLELSLGEYSMTTYTSSILAASALYLANKIFDISTPWCEELRIQSGYESSQLKECSKDLWLLLKKANELLLRCQRQIENIEQQEQEETKRLLNWYKEQKMILSQRPFDQESIEELENEYAMKKAGLESKIKELKSGVLSGTKNLVAVLRKFSLPKFQETAQLLLKLCTQQ